VIWGRCYFFAGSAELFRDATANRRRGEVVSGVDGLEWINQVSASLGNEKPGTKAGLIANIFPGCSNANSRTNIRSRRLRTKLHRNQKIGKIQQS
jgi:hypothetical protein